MSWKDEARGRVKEKMSGSSFKLADGENPFRILPNKKGPNFPPYIEGRVHYGVGPDEAMCACGKNIDGEGDCWLCDAAIPGLEKSSDSNKQAMAERIGPKEIFIVQVSPVDRDTGKFLKPKPFWVSTGRGTPGYTNAARPTLAVQVQSKLVMGKKSYDDPNKGYNLNITRHGTGKGKGTQYDPPEGDENPSVVPKEILAALQPLEEFVPKYNIEDQKACYYGKPRPDRNQSAPVSTSASAETEIDDDTQAEVDAGGFDPDFNPDADVPPDETEAVYDPEVVEEEEVPETDETEYNPEFETEAPPEDEFEPEPEPEPAPPPRRAPAPATKPQPKPATRPTPPAAPARRPPAPPARPASKPAAKPAARPAPPAKRR